MSSHFDKNISYYDRNAHKYERASWYYFNQYKKEMVVEELRLLLAQLSPGKPIRVLEIGPGTGYLLDTLLSVANRPVNYVGIEHSEAMGAILKQRHAHACESFELHRVSASPDTLDAIAGSEKFDLVMGSSILHHIPEYGQLVDALADALASGGVMYFVREPLHRDECEPPNALQRMGYSVFDSVNVFLFRSRIKDWLYPEKVKAESAVDIGIHMFRDGVSYAPFEALTAKGFTILRLRKYNRRLTSFLSRLENKWLACVRKDHFGNTLYAVCLKRD